MVDIGRSCNVGHSHYIEALEACDDLPGGMYIVTKNFKSVTASVSTVLKTPTSHMNVLCRSDAR